MYSIYWSFGALEGKNTLIMIISIALGALIEN